MALGFRTAVGIGRNVGSRSSNLVGSPSLALVTPSGHKQVTRSIVTKENLRLPLNYPEPWPYRERGYDFAKHSIFDSTIAHFHQNSKLIVVDGNMSAQKSQTARELADALGFYYYPEFKMDDIMIDRYGNDLRQYYHYFPESFRAPDMDMFYKNPYSDQVALMQWRYFQGRFDQYFNALAHIFNTGQGVVLERSIFSDCVFVNAMRSKDYIGPEFFRLYYYTRKNMLKRAHFWPHLVVYLDAPVHKCLENIKKRGNPDEIEHADEKYLSVIAESYKDVLREVKRYSCVLTYDWTEPGNTDSIVEDIENLKEMEFVEWHSSDIHYHWYQMVDGWQYNGWRWHVTDGKIRNYHDVFDTPVEALMEVGELQQHSMDMEHVERVMKNVILKSTKSHGFISERGDPIKGIFMFDRLDMNADKWYEYYWRERWYAEFSPPSSFFDPKGENYDPLYVHH